MFFSANTKVKYILLNRSPIKLVRTLGGLDFTNLSSGNTKQKDDDETVTSTVKN